MAFKMKASAYGNSPMKKNFPDMSGDGKVTQKDILMAKGVIDKPKSPAKEYGKSPAKNYKNPQDYKVFNMGNEPTPMKQVKPTDKDMKKYSDYEKYDEDGNKITRKQKREIRKEFKKAAKLGAAGTGKKKSPMKGYKSDAQRKAVHASKADGGKGAPNKMAHGKSPAKQGMKKVTKADKEKIRMANKMKPLDPNTLPKKPKDHKVPVARMGGARRTSPNKKYKK